MASCNTSLVMKAGAAETGYPAHGDGDLTPTLGAQGRTENPRVGGSIPPLGTNFFNGLAPRTVWLLLSANCDANRYGDDYRKESVRPYEPG